jgi:hypothetical protein
MDFYPEYDTTGFFKDRVSMLKDLSDSKLLVKLRELLVFSESREKYRIEWVEHNGFLVPDEKKFYPNLALKTMSFLKQEYIILPDSGSATANKWLKDLYKADSGSIELTKLEIRNEDPTKEAKLQKIVYTPLKSTFVAIFKEYDPMVNDELINRIIALSMKKFHRSFIVIPFTGNLEEDESFKQALNAFGNYLKDNKRSVLN